jgi:hypothetical protein
MQWIKKNKTLIMEKALHGKLNIEQHELKRKLGTDVGPSDG